jgi:hypothetical protein
MTTSDSPDISLILKGLFLLAFEKENKFCQAAVMRVERHCLKIEIDANSTANGPSKSTILELPTEGQERDILFEVAGRASGVSIYEGPDPFDRDTAQDLRDFRCVIDLEGREFYSRPLPFKAGVLKQSIFINNGQFYTDSAHKVLIISPISGQRTVWVADRIGCDIYLDDKEVGILRYGPDPESRKLLPKIDGISYKISLENLCQEPPATPRLSDFRFYYDVIDVPKEAQYMVNMAPPGRGDGDRLNPCIPTTTGLTKAPLSGTTGPVDQ